MQDTQKKKRGRPATGVNQTPQNFKIDNDLKPRLAPFTNLNQFINTAIREKLDRIGTTPATVDPADARNQTPAANPLQ